jgi:hypothetical protein
MPDIVYKFIADDELSPALLKIRDELEQLAKATAPSASSWAGVNQQLAQTSHHIEHANFLTQQLEEFVKGIGYTVGTWTLGFLAAEKAVELVGAAITNATTAEQMFVEQLNITRTSTEDQEGAFETFKKQALEGGLTFEEFNKSMMPTIKSLESLGESEYSAGEMGMVMGQYMKATGVDLRDIALKAELSTASFDDMIRAGNALGPAFGRWALSWKVYEQQLAEFNREHAREIQLDNESFAAGQRLAGARRGFAAQAGLEQTAFGAFQKAQQIGYGGVWKTLPYEIEANLSKYMPAEMAKMFQQVPGGLTGQNRGAIVQLFKEMQEEFRSGMQQVAKETGLTEEAVKVGVKVGAPGFDEKSILAAHQRAQAESQILQAQAEETRHYEDQTERVKALAAGNEQLRAALKERAGWDDYSAKRMEAYANWAKTAAGAISEINKGWEQQTLKAGDFFNMLRTGKLGNVPPENRTMLEMLQASMSTGLPQAPAAAAPAPGTAGEMKVSDSVMSGKMDQLLSLLKGSGTP